MITFKYRNEMSPRGRILRPVADVEIRSAGGAWIECHPYIDSGADITLIPFSMGKLLGLKMDRENIKELHGLGKQSIPVVFSKVSFRISKHEFPVEIGWSLIEEVPPLLGRKDVFDRFEITFKQPEKVITFDWNTSTTTTA